MSACGDYYDGQEKASITYQRDGDVVSITLRGMTNYEMRDFLVGMWLRLDEDDRRDHVRALQHYLEPGSVPPYVSRTLGAASDQPQMRRSPSSAMIFKLNKAGLLNKNGGRFSLKAL